MIDLENQNLDRGAKRSAPRAPAPNHPSQCRLCMFFDVGRSLCRRYPPAPTIRREIVAWPKVDPVNDWCAEGVTITAAETLPDKGKGPAGVQTAEPSLGS